MSLGEYILISEFILQQRIKFKKYFQCKACASQHEGSLNLDAH